MLGETEVPGFWVAAGFCAHGLAGAGGIGKVMAEWIVDGEPEYDLWHMDIRRFGRHYRSQRYTLARTVEVYSTYYDIRYPGDERQAGRPLRLSSTYDRLRALGAASARSRAGSARTGSSRTPAPGTSRCARTAGPGATGRPRSGPNAWRRATPLPCSTSPRSRRSTFTGRARARSSTACARMRSTGPPGA